MRRVLFSWRGIRVWSYPACLYLGLVLGVFAHQAAARSAGLDPLRSYVAILLLDAGLPVDVGTRDGRKTLLVEGEEITVDLGTPRVLPETKVSVGEQTVTDISGIVDGGSVSAQITTGDRSISYIRTPAGEWVAEADGAWVPLEGEAPPAAPPLAALADSTDVSLQSGDGVSGVLSGILGPAAGPAQGLPFTLTVSNGLVSGISYQVETQAGPAIVTTTLSDIGQAGAVAPPPAV